MYLSLSLYIYIYIYICIYTCRAATVSGEEQLLPGALQEQRLPLSALISKYNAIQLVLIICCYAMFYHMILY